jgi:ABC-type transport system involved in cytochrome bd biosynthesis fused ATPase/permease subunit
MDVVATYNSFFQVAAAFLIFIIGFLALLLLIVLCLLAVEGMHQGVILARGPLSKSIAEHRALSAEVVATAARGPAFWAWAHRLAVGHVGSLKLR